MGKIASVNNFLLCAGAIQMWSRVVLSYRDTQYFHSSRTWQLCSTFVPVKYCLEDGIPIIYSPAETYWGFPVKTSCLLEEKKFSGKFLFSYSKKLSLKKQSLLAKIRRTPLGCLDHFIFIQTSLAKHRFLFTGEVVLYDIHHVYKEHWCLQGLLVKLWT